MKASPRSRDTLLAAAMGLFATDGYFAVPEERLLQEAQVSRGILVYHFGNKAGLLQALLHQHIPEVQAILPSSSAPTQAIHPWIDAWTESLQTYTLWWRCFFRLSLHPETQQILESFAPYSDIFSQYRMGLRSYFSSNEFDKVEEEILSFEAFRLGISWAYLTHPDTYPLKQMKEVWAQKFS